jgi:glycosyltransferase involved in cell wall biosynthesis
LLAVHIFEVAMTHQAKPMHILFITHYFAPDSGAAAVRLTRLAKLLRARGHRITVLTTMPHFPEGRIREGYRGRWVRVDEIDGMRVVQVWLWATPSRKIIWRLLSQLSFMFMGFLRGLFVARPDVIFIENQPIFTGLMGWALSKIKRRPYLLNVSDFWPEHLVALGVMRESHPLYRIFRALVNLTQRQAHTVVTLSDELYTNIQKRIGHAKHQRTILNAADLALFDPNVADNGFRARHHLDERPIISFIGTFQSNLDYKAFFDVLGRFNGRDDVQFVLIGGGGNIYQVEERLQTEAWTHVRLLGWLPFEEIPQAWRVSYLTFWTVQANYAGRNQIFGKIYEAHAAGVPIVACTEEVMARFIQRSGGGITVPFGDVERAVQAIDAYLANPDLRAQHSQKARAFAEEHLDPENVASAYEEVLRQMMR